MRPSIRLSRSFEDVSLLAGFDDDRDRRRFIREGLLHFLFELRERVRLLAEGRQQVIELARFLWDQFEQELAVDDAQ